MNITELYPDAKPVERWDIRIGDHLAVQALGSADIRVFEIAGFTSDTNQPHAVSGAQVPTDGRRTYLVHRPASQPPTLPGSMVRITAPGSHRLAAAGDVLHWDGTRHYEHKGKGYLVHLNDFVDRSMGWEQVWYTTENPECIVDAEVIDEEADQNLQLPVGPGVLIKVTGGRNRGALLRRHATGNFQGISANALTLRMTTFEVEQAGWEAVATQRDQAFYGPHPF